MVGAVYHYISTRTIDQFAKYPLLLRDQNGQKGAEKNLISVVTLSMFDLLYCLFS